MNRVTIDCNKNGTFFSVNHGTPANPDWFTTEIPSGRTISLRVDEDGVEMHVLPLSEDELEALEESN